MAFTAWRSCSSHTGVVCTACTSGGEGSVVLHPSSVLAACLMKHEADGTTCVAQANTVRHPHAADTRGETSSQGRLARGSHAAAAAATFEPPSACLHVPTDPPVCLMRSNCFEKQLRRYMATNCAAAATHRSCMPPMPACGGPIDLIWKSTYKFQ